MLLWPDVPDVEDEEPLRAGIEDDEPLFIELPLDDGGLPVPWPVVDGGFVCPLLLCLSDGFCVPVCPVALFCAGACPLVFGWPLWPCPAVVVELEPCVELDSWALTLPDKPSAPTVRVSMLPVAENPSLRWKAIRAS